MLIMSGIISLFLLTVFIFSLRGHLFVPLALSGTWVPVAVFTRAFGLGFENSANLPLAAAIVFGPAVLGLAIFVVTRLTPQWWTWLTPDGDQKILFMLMTIPEEFSLNDSSEMPPWSFKHAATNLQISIGSELDDLKVTIGISRVYVSAIAKNLIQLRCMKMVKVSRKKESRSVYAPIDNWLKAGMPKKR